MCAFILKWHFRAYVIYEFKIYVYRTFEKKIIFSALALIFFNWQLVDISAVKFPPTHTRRFLHIWKKILFCHLTHISHFFWCHASPGIASKSLHIISLRLHAAYNNNNNNNTMFNSHIFPSSLRVSEVGIICIVLSCKRSQTIPRNRRKYSAHTHTAKHIFLFIAGGNVGSYIPLCTFVCAQEFIRPPNMRVCVCISGTTCYSMRRCEIVCFYMFYSRAAHMWCGVGGYGWRHHRWWKARKWYVLMRTTTRFDVFEYICKQTIRARKWRIHNFTKYFKENCRRGVCFIYVYSLYISQCFSLCWMCVCVCVVMHPYIAIDARVHHTKYIILER